MTDEKGEQVISALGALMTTLLAADSGVGANSNLVTLSAEPREFAAHLTRALGAALFCVPAGWLEDVRQFVEDRQVLGEPIEPIMDESPARLFEDLLN